MLPLEYEVLGEEENDSREATGNTRGDEPS